MSDKDKTVFGQRLPTPPSRQGQQQPPQQPQQPQQPPAPPQQPPRPQQGHGTADKTVFGAPLPQTGGGRVAPTRGQPQQPQYPQQQPPQQPQGGPAPGVEDTWLGGALNPGSYGMPTPPQPHYPQGQPQGGYQGGYQHPQHYNPQTGAVPAGQEMFPEIRDPSQQQSQPRQVPRIALEDALRGTGLGAGGPSNPLVAAAANLLILLGRLRSGVVEMQVMPLIEHVAREIDGFERNALEAAIPPQDVHDAKYALCATADDIVQNLPGADKGVWLQYSMVARFFGERSSGVLFFQKMDAAMKAPGQRFHLLELMLVCLNLGFEGQYRTAPNGSVDLARIRHAIYETLRRVTPRPDDDIAVRWAPVILGGKRRYGGVPIWVVAAVASAMVVAMFATLSTLLAREGAEVQQEILGLHRGTPELTIERSLPDTSAVNAAAPREKFEQDPGAQLERITSALQEEIDAGRLEVEDDGEFILVRMGDALRFRSGSADLENDISAIAAAIGRALNPEEGPLRVVGHTDAIPMSGRGRYKTNEELSAARAQTVAGVLAEELDDPDRIVTEGLGPVDPIATNDTPEGRARNRRVEVMIPKEDVS